MNKLSATKVAEVLTASAVLLRNAGSEINFLRSKVAELQKQVTQNALEKRANVLATAMQNAGLDSDLSFEQKVAQIMKRAQEIDVLEQAVKMASKASAEGGELFEDGSTPAGTGATKTRLLDYIVTAP